MDNDPSQTSAKAMNALKQLRICFQNIPPRSPDLNPIENLFHVVRRQLREDAKEKCIIKETCDEFVIRVKSTILAMSTIYIDKTIESMTKRVQQIICSKGRQIQY